MVLLVRNSDRHGGDTLSLSMMFGDLRMAQVIGGWLGWLDWHHMSLSALLRSPRCDLSTSLAWISSRLSGLRVAEFFTWQPATLRDKKKLLGLLKISLELAQHHFCHVYWSRQVRRSALMGAVGGAEIDPILVSGVASMIKEGRNGKQPPSETSHQSPLSCPAYLLTGFSQEPFLIETTCTYILISGLPPGNLTLR